MHSYIYGKKMAFLIKQTYLGDIKPRQIFNNYLSKDFNDWVINIHDMFVTSTYDEAEKVAVAIDFKGSTYDIIGKDDAYLAKMYLQDSGYGV